MIFNEHLSISLLNNQFNCQRAKVPSIRDSSKIFFKRKECKAGAESAKMLTKFILKLSNFQIELAHCHIASLALPKHREKNWNIGTLLHWHIGTPEASGETLAH